MDIAAYAPSATPIVSEGVAWVSGPEGCFICNLRTSTVQQLSGTAAFLWEAIDGRTSADGICTRAERAFGAQFTEQIRSDVRQFLASMKALGMIELDRTEIQP